jgi:hypothetical protein
MSSVLSAGSNGRTMEPVTLSHNHNTGHGLLPPAFQV